MNNKRIYPPINPTPKVDEEAYRYKGKNKNKNVEKMRVKLNSLKKGDFISVETEEILPKTCRVVEVNPFNNHLVVVEGIHRGKYYLKTIRHKAIIKVFNKNYSFIEGIVKQIEVGRSLEIEVGDLITFENKKLSPTRKTTTAAVIGINYLFDEPIYKVSAKIDELEYEIHVLGRHILEIKKTGGS